jgi:hypothetical protein
MNAASPVLQYKTVYEKRHHGFGEMSHVILSKYRKSTLDSKYGILRNDSSCAKSHHICAHNSHIYIYIYIFLAKKQSSSLYRPQGFIADIQKTATRLTDQNLIHIFISLPISSWFGDPHNILKLQIMQFSPTAIVIVCRDSSVGTATRYGLDDGRVGVGVPVGSRIFFSPYRPDRLWGSPSLLSNGYREFFPGG